MAAGGCREGCGVDLDVLHVDVPQAYALDMDRTLTSVEMSVERLETVAEQFGVTVQPEVSGDGGSVSPLHQVRDALSPEAFDSFGQAFLAAERPPLAYGDTGPLLDTLIDNRVPWLIPTYGVENLWQGMKAAAFDTLRSKYLEIMPHSRKGPHVEGWRGPGGTFDFIGMDSKGEPRAVYHAEQVVLVDDKLISHEGLPADCAGAVLLRRPEDAAVPEELADRVHVIHSLSKLSIAAAGPDTYVPPATVFRPAYAERQPFPGVLVPRGMSFAALRATIDRLGPIPTAAA